MAISYQPEGIGRQEAGIEDRGIEDRSERLLVDIGLAFRFEDFVMAASVADLCRQQSLTVEELVERSGLDEGRVLAIVLGRWTPSPLERQKIAGALSVGVDEIAWGHKTPIQHLYGHGPG